ncbi:MAG: aspartate kinase [Terriglobia bacterium]
MPIEPHSEYSRPHPTFQGQIRRNGGKPLLVMKFGGTSVGDASCIEKVVEIVRAASPENDVVVVVSAMSGVTNQLIEAARYSEAGDHKSVAKTLEKLRQQHEAVTSVLIHSAAERTRIAHEMEELLQEGDRLCQGTILLRELTSRALDSISSLGERLSAPLVAAALMERGVASEAIEATKLIETDSYHGNAEPRMEPTRERCQARLLPLLHQGIVPVVTGFIGATAEGALTTLGRGGSDYSATILGAVLDADEVIIWTDVDGLMSADPRLVPDAYPISEISYHEAADLAHFGARVMHPKTLRAMMQCGIPVWIRNTFAPERPGTKITPAGSSNGAGVKALTAISDVALITVGGPGMVGVPDVLVRTFTTMAAIRADVLLVSHSSSQNHICLVVPLALAKRTAEALRSEFAPHLAQEKLESVSVDSSLAIVTVVGKNLRSKSGIFGRTFGALDRENVKIMAIAQGSSECSISLVVAQKDLKAALLAAHREFQLGCAEFTGPSCEKPLQPACDAVIGM